MRYKSIPIAGVSDAGTEDQEPRSRVDSSGDVPSSDDACFRGEQWPWDN